MSSSRRSFESDEPPALPPRRNVSHGTGTTDSAVPDRPPRHPKHSMDETRETSTSEEVKATTDDAAKGIKGVWNVIHGAGEQLRGSVNQFVDKVGDTVSNDSRKNTKSANELENERVVRAGEEEMRKGTDTVSRLN